MDVIYFCLATQINIMLEDRRQSYFRHWQIGKKIFAIFDRMRQEQIASPRLYM